MIALEVAITIDERRLSPAVVVAALVRGFEMYRASLDLEEGALDLRLETLTVRQASRRLQPRQAVSPTRSPDDTDEEGES